MTIKELYEQAVRGGYEDKELYVYAMYNGGRVAVGGPVTEIREETDSVYLWNEEV